MEMGDFEPGLVESSTHSESGGRVREDKRAPIVEESHYSIMDCTCQAVSAFLSFQALTWPLSTFPYPSEIYHVKPNATRGGKR